MSKTVLNITDPSDEHLDFIMDEDGDIIIVNNNEDLINEIADEEFAMVISELENYLG